MGEWLSDILILFCLLTCPEIAAVVLPTRTLPAAGSSGRGIWIAGTVYESDTDPSRPLHVDNVRCPVRYC